MRRVRTKPLLPSLSRPWLPLAVLPAVALLGGCALSPEEKLVGAWSLDPVATEIPKVPFPGAEKRVRDATRNMKLKLRNDKTFVLASGPVPSEGTWGLVGKQIQLKPTDERAANLLRNEDGILEANLGPSGKTLVIDQTTPFGVIKIVLKKTG